jgi:hypothetical protein
MQMQGLQDGDQDQRPGSDADIQDDTSQDVAPAEPVTSASQALALATERQRYPVFFWR